MYELITDKTLAEYEAFLQSHPKGHFAQSSLWAKQKPMWTWDAVAVRGEDGKIKGSLALMTRRVPGIGRTLMYGCRGPVCDLDDRETFAQLLEGAKALAKKYKSYVIKLDPDVPSSNTAFAALMQSFGFRCKEGGKNFEAIQPRYVFRLNVEGKTEEELMASFHQKWRYNIRLAERKGVTVQICGKEMVPAFADLMLTTGVRDGFASPSILQTCSTISASTRGSTWRSTPREPPSRARLPFTTATRSGISMARPATSTAI